MEEKANSKKGNIVTENGSIVIADEVVKNIAGLTAMEVEGVAAMSGGIGSGILELIRKKDFSKGVKVEVADNEAVLDIYLAVDYKYAIPAVATEVQSKVKLAIEAKTGLIAKEVNVHVVAVSIEKPEGTPETVENA
ncbi:MAG: Asp23/Gls24 family envelope stress response protein [Firmicutes bacterium]|nr:Asp23/Gls24 family envelope stress response protein [Bacillota bacterium]